MDRAAGVKFSSCECQIAVCSLHGLLADFDWNSPMPWLFFAFSGPVLWAISTHFDKYLVEKYFKQSDVAVLLLFTAFIGVLTLPVIAFCEPAAIVSPGAGSIALMMLSGILYVGAMLFYLRALQSEEASAVSPFFQAAPLFGYVLAYFFLGETLSVQQMAGGALIVAGTLIVSIRFGRNVRVFKVRLAILMLACGFALALSGLIFKIFRDTGRVLGHHILDVRWRSDLRRRVALNQFLPQATCRRAARKYDRAFDRQRIERTHQSRRHGGKPLCPDVRAVEHRPGHRQHDDFICLCLRCCVQRFLPALCAGDVVRSRIGTEGNRGLSRRRWRRAGDALTPNAWPGLSGAKPGSDRLAQMPIPDFANAASGLRGYCGAITQIATSGALAAFASTPHETCRSPRNVA